MVTGPELRRARLKRRLSQEQLGRLLGVGTRTVRRWEAMDELPEAAVLATEDFLRRTAEDPHVEKTLKTASLLELVTEVLIRVSSGNETPTPADGRHEYDLPQPDDGTDSQT